MKKNTFINSEGEIHCAICHSESNGCRHSIKKPHIPYQQVTELAELAWKLGIQINQISLLGSIDKGNKVKVIETPFMKIKIK